MERLCTPLLRRVYALFGCFAAIYLVVLGVQYSSWNKERLYRRLLAGGEEERASAGFDLAYLKGEPQLIRALKAPSPEVRLVAMNALWSLWARAGGHEAFQQVQQANQAVARKAYPQALKILTRLTREHPEFSEGWNRRATLYWELGRFEEAVADAQKVITLNPNHFGAWQGLALCHAQLGNLEEACRCLRTALKITPHDEPLRRFLRQCEEILDLMRNRERPQYDLV